MYAEGLYRVNSTNPQVDVWIKHFFQIAILREGDGEEMGRLLCKEQ